MEDEPCLDRVGLSCGFIRTLWRDTVIAQSERSFCHYEDFGRDQRHAPTQEHSRNVTLLISRRVVRPARTFLSPDSRRNDMPSSLAARLISEVGRREMIISRMRSERSRSSLIADLP